ncbi:MAG: hypothetical protein IKD27_04345 [Oscillospiraceae bacterium]|nr:hypothetical protein [Oscillospiraceae bacterium]
MSSMVFPPSAHNFNLIIADFTGIVKRIMQRVILKIVKNGRRRRPFDLVKKVPVGATTGRPLILLQQNQSPQGEKNSDFPSGNPKIKDFRRASNARPYVVHRNTSSLTV